MDQLERPLLAYSVEKLRLQPVLPGASATVEPTKPSPSKGLCRPTRRRVVLVSFLDQFERISEHGGNVLGRTARYLQATASLRAVRRETAYDGLSS